MTTKDTKVPKLRFNKKMFTVCQKLLIWVFSYVDPTVIVETFTPYLHNFYSMFFWFPPYILVLKYFCMSILYYFFFHFCFFAVKKLTFIFGHLSVHLFYEKTYKNYSIYLPTFDRKTWKTKTCSCSRLRETEIKRRKMNIMLSVGLLATL